MVNQLYEALLATPVHSRDWWFAPAVGVRLGDELEWSLLSNWLALSTTTEGLPSRSGFERSWVREAQPIAFGISLGAVDEKVELSIDFVVACVRLTDNDTRRIEYTYVFSL